MLVPRWRRAAPTAESLAAPIAHRQERGGVPARGAKQQRRPDCCSRRHGAMRLDHCAPPHSPEERPRCSTLGRRASASGDRAARTARTIAFVFSLLEIRLSLRRRCIRSGAGSVNDTGLPRIATPRAPLIGAGNGLPRCLDLNGPGLPNADGEAARRHLGHEAVAQTVLVKRPLRVR